MSKLQIDDGYGYASVQVGDGPPVVLDLWEANNVYAGLEQEAADAVALADAWRNWLIRKGLPDLSHGAAFAVADHVMATIAALKKNGTCSAKPG